MVWTGNLADTSKLGLRSDFDAGLSYPEASPRRGRQGFFDRTRMFWLVGDLSFKGWRFCCFGTGDYRSYFCWPIRTYRMSGLWRL